LLNLRRLYADGTRVDLIDIDELTMTTPSPSSRSWARRW
jgi:hypothetical protein